MSVHILNGDALAGTFERSGIHGEVITCRECFIDGPVSRVADDSFWSRRAEFIEDQFDAPPGEYAQRVKEQFQKITRLTSEDDVFLWFEHDLFCQTNMWFVISLLNVAGVIHAYRVSPLPRLNTKWQGFGNHTPEDLKASLQNRVEFSPGDFKLGDDLWEAYCQQDMARLTSLSGALSPCFPRLDEVCRAETERRKSSRPKKTLQDILSKGYSEFNDIFMQFSQREGIYGFGDSQVRLMLKDLRR
jgi:hypothetical protein